MPDLLTITRHLSALIILSWALSGCLFDSSVEWMDEKYRVAWIDSADYTLYCTIGNGGSEKIKPTIIGVGSNDLFVVALRRAEGGRTQYYYIAKEPDKSYPCDADQTYGPYDAAQFARLKEDLGLPNFEKHFD